MKCSFKAASAVYSHIDATILVVLPFVVSMQLQPQTVIPIEGRSTLRPLLYKQCIVLVTQYCTYKPTPTLHVNPIDPSPSNDRKRLIVPKSQKYQRDYHCGYQNANVFIQQDIPLVEANFGHYQFIFCLVRYLENIL